MRQALRVFWVYYNKREGKGLRIETRRDREREGKGLSLGFQECERNNNVSTQRLKKADGLVLYLISDYNNDQGMFMLCYTPSFLLWTTSLHVHLPYQGLILIVQKSILTKDNNTRKSKATTFCATILIRNSVNGGANMINLYESN